MAACEDQAKPVVLHGTHLQGDAGIFVTRREHRRFAKQLPFTRLSAQAVDGPIAGGRCDPAARVGRQSVIRPLAQRNSERLLHSVLCYVDVAEDPDQRSHRSAGLLAEDPADLGLVELRGGVAHAVKPRRRGTASIGLLTAAAVFDAQASAASRSLASMT